jgi:hypothetical protein
LEHHVLEKLPQRLAALLTNRLINALLIRGNYVPARCVIRMWVHKRYFPKCLTPGWHVLQGVLEYHALFWVSWAGIIQVRSSRSWVGASFSFQFIITVSSFRDCLHLGGIVLHCKVFLTAQGHSCRVGPCPGQGIL